MSRKKPLSHQVVVIAGGSYGLGRSIARAAADRGAKVVVGARTREALDAVVDEVEATGPEALAVEADGLDGTTSTGSWPSPWSASAASTRTSRMPWVQIASALSYRAIPRQAAYCASKPALRAFFESARVEQEKERSGVDICVILPGAINTPQFDSARQKIGLQPQPVPPIYGPEPF